MAVCAAQQFSARDIYRSFRADRNVALHRVLRRLPDRFIAALAEGLEQADVITPGQLFAGERGGCAVGVTLRVLYPEYRGRSGPWLRRRRRSIAALRRRLAGEVSFLYALEEVFDRSVLLLQEHFQHVPPQRVAEATAHWIAGEARTELVLREMSSDWLQRIVADRRRGSGADRLRGPSMIGSPLRAAAQSGRAG